MGNCQKCPADTARFRVSTTAGGFPAVHASRRLAGASAQEIICRSDLKKVDRSLIGKNDLTRGIDREKNVGDGIDQLLNLRPRSDFFCLRLKDVLRGPNICGWDHNHRESHITPGSPVEQQKSRIPKVGGIQKIPS